MNSIAVEKEIEMKKQIIYVVADFGAQIALNTRKNSFYI